MRTDILEQKDKILQWIEEKQSKAYICRQLSCKPETLESYLKKMGISYSGNPSGKGIRISKEYKNALYYIENDIPIKSHSLKLKLIHDGIKEQKCEICGNSMWNGQIIPLELHHIDGNHYNNKLDNLQILCPNCHAQQNGNAGANTGHYNTKNYCIDCGKEISKHSIRCEECYHKSIKGVYKIALEDMPVSRKELKQLIRTTPFTTIGKMYNISDNGVRKWCIKYNLPTKSRDIKSISDEEWDNI